jgi:hypothetical protein
MVVSVMKNVKLKLLRAMKEKNKHHRGCRNEDAEAYNNKLKAADAEAYNNKLKAANEEEAHRLMVQWNLQVQAQAF